MCKYTITSCIQLYNKITKYDDLSELINELTRHFNNCQMLCGRSCSIYESLWIC